MKKKHLNTAVALAMVIPFVSICAAWDNPYTDMYEEHWAYEYIMEATHKGWFNGYEDGSFQPDESIERAEVAKVLAIITDQFSSYKTYDDMFTDVKYDWSRNYANSAYYMFLDVENMQLPSDFRPRENITREEAFFAFMSGFRFLDTDYDLSNLDQFADSDEVLEAMQKVTSIAVEYGLVKGKIDDFDDVDVFLNSKGELERAEFAALVVRFANMGVNSYASRWINLSKTKLVDEDNYIYNLVGNVENGGLPLTQLFVDFGTDSQVEINLNDDGTYDVEVCLNPLITKHELLLTDLYGSKTKIYFEVEIPENAQTNELLESNEPEIEVKTADEIRAEFEAEVLRLTNIERANAGLEPLSLSIEYSSTAYDKSKDMADKNYFSHTDNSGYNMANDLNVGENIAAGYDCAEDVVEAWMDSPGHKANILHARYTTIGIGYCYKDNSTYGHYWTQQFK